MSKIDLNLLFDPQLIFSFSIYLIEIFISVWTGSIFVLFLRTQIEEKFLHIHCEGNLLSRGFDGIDF